MPFRSLAGPGTARFRRSVVADAEDRRMRLALGLWGGPSLREPLVHEPGGPALSISLCLLTMEEDEEADGGGFPRIVTEEDDEHLVCGPTEERWISTSVTAVAVAGAGPGLPVGLRAVDGDGVAAFDLDLRSDACRGARAVRFRHEESGAVLELELVPGRGGDGAAGDSGSPRTPGPSWAIEMDEADAATDDKDEDDEDDDGSADEFEDDGFVVNDEDDDDDDENDVCTICQGHGELMVCDGGDRMEGCGRSFHIACIDRVVVPEGDWVCQDCANESDLREARGAGIEGYEFVTQGSAANDPEEATKRLKRKGRAVVEDSESSDEDVDSDAVVGSGKQGMGMPKRRRVLDDDSD